MSGYLDHRLECPYCHTVRLCVPAEVTIFTEISCDDCGEYLGTWEEMLEDFDKQGGNDGIFRLEKGRIRKLD
jgi:hypothetical protein